MAWVVDASVATKWFFQEAYTEEARRIISSGRPILAPCFLITEVCNVAWRRVLEGEATEDQLAAVISALPDILSHVDATIELIPRAVELATELRCSVYTCVYLALAESKEADFVSADQSLIEQLTSAGWAGSATYLADVARTVSPRVPTLSAVTVKAR